MEFELIQQDGNEEKEEESEHKLSEMVPFSEKVWIDHFISQKVSLNNYQGKS